MRSTASPAARSSDPAVICGTHIAPARLGLTLAVALVTACATGCEDEDSRARAQVQATISSAGQRLSLLDSGNVQSGDARATESELSSIARELASVNGNNAAPGQVAAAALLASEAERGLAQLDLAAASALISAQVPAQAELQSVIENGLRLEVAAEARRSVDAGALLSTLKQRERAAAALLADVERAIAEIDQPIREREQENQQDERAAEDLERRANELRREATNLGASAGFATFQEAVGLERNADQLKFAVARRDGELDYEFRPQHRLDVSKRDALTSLRTKIRATQSDLESMGSRLRALSDADQQDVSRRRREIEDALKAIEGEINGSLRQRLDSAAAHLEQSASLAQRGGGSGPGASSSRLAIARAHALRAQVHLTDASVAEELAAIYAKLGTSNGGLADAARAATRAKELAAAAEKAKGAATEALNGAKSEAAAGGESAAPVARQIDRAIDAVAGRVRSGDEEQAVPMLSVQGYESAQALIDALGAPPDGDMVRMERVLRAIRAQQAHARLVLATQHQLLGPSRRLYDSLKRNLPAASYEAAVASVAQMSPNPFAGAKLVQSDDESGQATVDGPTGSVAFRILKTESGWVADGDELFAMIPPEAAGMLREMAPKLGAALDRLAKQLDSGTPIDMAQFQQEIMRALSGG